GSAALEAWPEKLAAGGASSAPYLLDGAGLRGSQTGVVCSRAGGSRDARVGDGVVSACARIADDTVGHPVHGIARRDGSVGCQVLLGGRNRSAVFEAHGHRR